MNLGKIFVVKVGLSLSAGFAIAGLAGLLMVIDMGLLPSNNQMGHSPNYEQGWQVFFLLVLGLPCLTAFIAGLTPWIIWFKRRREKHFNRNGFI